jgi:hypothetical protein
MVLYFIGNVIATDVQEYRICLALTSQTRLIQTMLIAMKNCDEELLRVLCWVASILMQYKVTPCISRTDVIQLCKIGFEGLMCNIMQADESVKSDSCWLFNYAFENEKWELISEIATPIIVLALTQAISSNDLQTSWPALRAVANLLCQENAELVDKIIFHGILDKMIAFSELEPLNEAILVEIAFCLSNIAAGTLH